jgi:hypothetical protein
MSAATSVGAIGYDAWCVVRDGKTVGADGMTQFTYRAMFAPVYQRCTVAGAYRSQEDAERLARKLTEENTPFG